MRFLIKCDCHLPLFAAMDIVRAFFSPLANHILSVRRPQIHDASFRKRYDRYAEFIYAFSNIPGLRRTGNDFQELTRIRGGENLEAEFYLATRFILFEWSTKCPFVRWGETYPLDLVNEITMDQIAKSRTDADCFLQKDEEAHLLRALGLVDDGSQDPNHRFISTHSSEEMDAILAPTMEIFRAAKQEENHDLTTLLAELPQLIDYKLIDLYLHYYDNFEPSEDLRHKIARLDLLSRTAIKRSPHYDRYSDLSYQGTPNPTYLNMGFDRFFIKMIEGAPVFIGNDPPIKDQDRMAVRFYFIEDIKSLNEKIVRESWVKGKAYERYSHANIHKLVSFLLCHDMTRYLGIITHLDIKVQFAKYRVEDHCVCVSTMPISIRAMRRNHSLNSGFVIRNRDLHKEFLIESRGTAADYREPDAEFLRHFFEATGTSLKASSLYSQNYDVFFGCGGTFIGGNETLPAVPEPQNCMLMNRKNEYHASTALTQVLESSSQCRLPTHNGAFVMETNHRYLFASGAGDHLESRVDEDNLGNFLGRVREYFLDYIADEAIRLKDGKHNA